MKILITGTQGLAQALAECYQEEHVVTMVSRRTGHDIAQVNQWGAEFLEYDLLFNNAYQSFDQVKVLEFFFSAWRNIPEKIIVNIGSRCICYSDPDHPRGYWPYRSHKQALQTTYDAMQLEAKCDLKIINPGLVNTAMVSNVAKPKFSTQELATKIKYYVDDPTVKRVDLWL